MFKRIIIRLAAIAAIPMLGLGIAAAPAFADGPPPLEGQGTTNATLNVGNLVGVTGFPTSVALSGTPGSTATAVATPYAVFANTPYSLTWGADPDTQFTAGGQAYWHVGDISAPIFQIDGSTTLTHGSNTFGFGSDVTASPVVIETGASSDGQTMITDTYNVAIPAAAGPGLYHADFDYVLSATS